MLDLPALWSALTEPDNSAGGIRVTYTGATGDVLALGGLENDGEGYSATVRFSSPLPNPAHGNANPKLPTQTYAAVGLLMGAPMNELGFPVGTSFQIYTALRNTTSRPMSVAMAANYMSGKSPSSIALPTVQLSPYESRYLDMPGTLSKAGLGNFSGMLNLAFTFQGSQPDLLVATGSLDATGTYVFEVPPKSTATSLMKEVSYWSVANGSDTMIDLWNPASTP